MMPLLVEASPGFAGKWEEIQAEWVDEPSLPYYLALADFARHLCDLLVAGNEPALQRSFAVVERFHVEGDHFVQEAATVGLLENLQNTNLHQDHTSPTLFEKYLLPTSARFWKKLHTFWHEGKPRTGD